MNSHSHVKLLSDLAMPDGGRSFEYVAAEDLGENRYRLLDSPKAVYGCAKGDVVEITQDEDFVVVERGGRVSVQVFIRERGEQALAEALDGLRPLGGTLDNRTPPADVFVISLPAEVGHRALSSFMESLKRRYHGMEWNYGNLLSQTGSGEFLPWAAGFLKT